MKLMRNILELVRPQFEEGGLFSRMHPIFQAADGFFFAADEKPQNAPFGRDPLDIKRYMSLVIVALVPCLAASIYFFGWRVLAVVMVSYIAGGMVEVLFAIVRKEEINEGFLVTGLIFPLVLPPGIPLWLVAVGIIFGVLVGKEIFGGTGRNPFNPALVGRCFLALSYPAIMAGAWMPPPSEPLGRLLAPVQLGLPDAVTSATPLVDAKSGLFAPLQDLFTGQVAGSIGETSALAIVLGGLFLIVVGIASWRTVLSVLVSFVGLNVILRIVSPESVSPVLFNLLSGGLLFGAFFMATDPVTGPTTQAGKWAYGILIGSVTLLIRSFSGYVEGMMFAILLGNICAPLIDECVIRIHSWRYARDGS